MEDLFRRNDDLLHGLVDDDLVVADVESGKYYWLNWTGARVWGLLSEPRTLAGICDVLVRESVVEWAECERTVADFLAALEARGAVSRLS